MTSPARLSIEVFFDLICPWCLIGKRHLETAIAQLRAERPGLAVDVEWHSLPLLPDVPLAGLPYAEFYVKRLGSPAAVAARQAQVQAAALDAGLTLALTRIETFPNTLLAHRVVRYARQECGAEAASTLIENLFARYFLRGEDIGDSRVLRLALLECGIAAPEPLVSPLHHDAQWLPQLHDAREPHARGGLGVPHFIFNGSHSLSGAQPPAVLLQAMRQALA